MGRSKLRQNCKPSRPSERPFPSPFHNPFDATPSTSHPPHTPVFQATDDLSPRSTPPPLLTTPAYPRSLLLPISPPTSPPTFPPALSTDTKSKSIKTILLASLPAKLSSTDLPPWLPALASALQSNDTEDTLSALIAALRNVKSLENELAWEASERVRWMSRAQLLAAELEGGRQKGYLVNQGQTALGKIRMKASPMGPDGDSQTQIAGGTGDKPFKKPKKPATAAAGRQKVKKDLVTNSQEKREKETLFDHADNRNINDAKQVRKQSGKRPAGAWDVTPPPLPPFKRVKMGKIQTRALEIFRLGKALAEGDSWESIVDQNVVRPVSLDMKAISGTGKVLKTKMGSSEMAEADENGETTGGHGVYQDDEKSVGGRERGWVALNRPHVPKLTGLSEVDVREIEMEEERQRKEVLNALIEKEVLKEVESENGTESDCTERTWNGGDEE